MRLTFYGGTKIVTGANYLLEGKRTKILIDCGLFQGASYVEKENFLPFAYNPAKIDAVLITHAHIDHTGRLPKLFKEGFSGKIFSTFPTKEFAEHLLIDSEHLLEKEARRKRKKPLYSIKDVVKVMKLWNGVDYHQKIKIKDFEIQFFDAGHILGSAFILIREIGTNKKIVFSGDLGNEKMPLVKETEPLKEADYVVIESTYGNRVHEDVLKRKDILEDLIEETFKNKGVLLLPAFAMERTQELLYELNELVENKRIPRVSIFLDSPLAIKLTAIYKKYSDDPMYFDKEAISLLRKGDAIFDFKGFHLSLTTQQSKAIAEVSPPKVIIAGSGMSNGGRILHHEKRYLPGKNNTILFIGYQAKGSLGRQILEGKKEVKILGEKVKVRCRVKAIGGYSAHADSVKLLNWLKPKRRKIKKVFVVQGEKDQAIPFAQKIKDQLAVEAVVPDLGDRFVL